MIEKLRDSFRIINQISHDVGVKRLSLASNVGVAERSGSLHSLAEPSERALMTMHFSFLRNVSTVSALYIEDRLGILRGISPSPMRLSKGN